MLEYRNGGPTAVDNSVLLCGHHHRSFAQSGWTVDILDGLPWWTPPRWLDPDQNKVHNTARDHCTL